MFHETKENKMFKKTLLALAITGFAGVATAASSVIDPNGSGVTANDTIQTISLEGAVNDTKVTPALVSFDIDATQLANYSNLQKVVVDITGGTLSAGTSAVLALVNAGADGFATNVVTYPTLTRVEFAVTDDNADGGNNGLTLTGPAGFSISGIEIVADSFDSASQIKYTITAESAVAGAAIEAATSTITQVVGQFSAAVSTKIGTVKVDVEDGRETFVGGGLADAAVVTITDAGSDLLTAVPEDDTQDYTLKGDFSYLDTDADGIQDGTLDGTNAEDLQSTTFTDVVGALAAQTFNIVNPASNVIQTQALTADASFDYNPATPGASVVKFTATDLAAGEWVLNGSEDTIAFLPFGSAYAQSVTVTNLSATTGEITIELTSGGETYTNVLTAQADAKSVTDISSEVAAFAAASGITGNTSIKVIVNAPDSNDEIQVKGVYYHKATQDRVLTY